MKPTLLLVLVGTLILSGCHSPTPNTSSEVVPSQKEISEKSVKPGINDRYLDENLKVQEFIDLFEGESREIYELKRFILENVDLQPDMKIADVGAGTGLFTVLFANVVGEGGQVYAVDIIPKFIEHIKNRATTLGYPQIVPHLGEEKSITLEADLVDVVFVCETYHHFEYPLSMLNSIHKSLKKGGKLYIVDFKREEGITPSWVLEHVRLGKEDVIKEVESAGFTFEATLPVRGMLDNYMISFVKK